MELAKNNANYKMARIGHFSKKLWPATALRVNILDGPPKMSSLFFSSKFSSPSVIGFTLTFVDLC